MTAAELPSNWRVRVAKVYDRLNRRYFSSRLPKSEDVIFRAVSTRKKYASAASAGYYIDRSKNRRSLGISFNARSAAMILKPPSVRAIVEAPDEDDLGEEIWFSRSPEIIKNEAAQSKVLMLHEMVHIEQYVECKPRGHGPFFLDRMRELGYPFEADRFEPKRKKRSQPMECLQTVLLFPNDRVQVYVDIGQRDWTWGCKRARREWRTGTVVRVNKASITVDLDELVLSTALNGGVKGGDPFADSYQESIEKEGTTRVRVGPERDTARALDCVAKQVTGKRLERK